jgi:peptidoglycan/LPS O-acetylase OafA/YrhL
MGAGVVIGPAVTVSPFVAVTAPAQLPPFPLLAALPQGATPLAWALPLTGVVAGVLAGLVIARQARREPRLVRLALAAGAAVVAGTLLALAAFLAAGSLGDLRLAYLGPIPVTVGILGAVLVVLGAAPSAAAAASTDRRRLSVANETVEDPAASSVTDDTP